MNISPAAIYENGESVSFGQINSSEPSFETDRMKFIGRGRTVSSPAAFDGQSPLSNTVGSTLDPIVSIRKRLILQPGQTVRVDIVCGVSENRSGVLGMAEKYSDPGLADRVFELAWTRSPIMLQQLNATEADAQALAVSVVQSSFRLLSGALEPVCSSGIAAVSQDSGGTAFPVICPSCLYASVIRKKCRSFVMHFEHTHIGV